MTFFCLLNLKHFENQNFFFVQIIELCSGAAFGDSKNLFGGGGELDRSAQVIVLPTCILEVTSLNLI
jgi:hypothetical protein